MSSTASVIVGCRLCGAKNRVPVERLGDAGRCGSCKEILPAASEPIAADESLFDAIVTAAKVPVFVDLWAAWCGPCRMAAPEVEKLAQEMSGRAIVLKVDTEANERLAARYRIQSIPSFLVLHRGQVVLQRAGVVPHTEMRRWVMDATSAAR